MFVLVCLSGNFGFEIVLGCCEEERGRESMGEMVIFSSKKILFCVNVV